MNACSLLAYCFIIVNSVLCIINYALVLIDAIYCIKELNYFIISNIYVEQINCLCAMCRLCVYKLFVFCIQLLCCIILFSVAW